MIELHAFSNNLESKHTIYGVEWHSKKNQPIWHGIHVITAESFIQHQRTQDISFLRAIDSLCKFAAKVYLKYFFKFGNNPQKTIFNVLFIIFKFIGF